MPDGEDRAAEEVDWPQNYFNYFTEIEEHFRRARGTGLFLLSPVDWALIETWRSSGIPLEAVLKGIDAAFEKWRTRKTKRRLVNSLAYCAQAVLEAVERTPDRASASNSGSRESPFAAEEIDRHLNRSAYALREAGETSLSELAASLETLAGESANFVHRLEELEQRLTAMEEKMVAIVRAQQSEEELFALRQTLDAELRPYRSKMNAGQLAALERRYLDTALLERAKLPRLSLFYLH